MTIVPLLRFTPRALPAEDLEAIFIKREPQAKAVVESVRLLGKGQGVRHHLFFGPRGVGKTHLVSIVANRLAVDKNLADKVVVSWLPEDNWGIFDYETLISQIGEAAGFEVTTDEDLLSELAGRKLVVVVENLDEVFKSITVSGEHRLRALIENSHQVMLIATCVARFPGISDHDRPFFGAFEFDDLSEFSVAEASELLSKVALREGNTELASMLRSPLGMDRLRVVERLAGGHPRIWMLLAGCLSIETIDELVPLFLRSLDDLTPYYQERMKSLAPGHRAIVVALCADGLVGALPVGEIARRSRIAERSAPQLLDQLVTKGFVRFVRADSVPGTGDGRVKYYELREPLHRLSVQMKRAKGGPLELVVRFLRNWYGADLVRAARGLAKTSIAYGYVNQALGNLDDLTRAGFFAGSASALRERAEGLRELRPEAEPFALLAEGLADLEDGEPSIAIATLERACQADPDSANAPEALGRAFLRAERFDDAVGSFETAVTRRRQVLGVDHEDTLRSRHNLGLSLALAGRDEAVGMYSALIPDRTRILGPDHPDTLSSRSNLGWSQGRAGRHQDAITTYIDLIADRTRILGPDHPDTLSSRSNLGRCQALAGHHNQAIEIYTELIADRTRILGPDHRNTLWSRHNIGWSQALAGHHNEAITTFTNLMADRTRVLGSDHLDTLETRHNLGRSQALAGHHNEAITTFTDLIPDRTLALGPSHFGTLWTLNGLANVLNRAGDHRRAAEVIAGAAAAKPTFGLTLVESLLLADEFREAVEAFEAVTEVAEPADYVESASFLFDELGHQLVLKDPAFTVAWLVDRHVPIGQLDALATGLTRGLGGFVKAANPEQLSRWAEAWNQAALTHAELLIASELLSAAAAWAADQDQRHLLALPPELREILVPIIEATGLTKPTAKKKPQGRPIKK
jgi:tetratricopeptide (TPR) repeat protein